MKYSIINANTSLGVHINGSELGPKILSSEFNDCNIINIENDDNIKENDTSNMHKNEDKINSFTNKMFTSTLKFLNSNNFPIVIGGDHSCVIGNILAVNKFYNNIGIIWIDAHADYNTFETTLTGNIHGLPLAAVTGYKNASLTSFLKCNYINPKNCVIFGARNIDPLELENLKNNGITIFYASDIKNIGINQLLTKAINIANNNTNGIYISFDLDVIDPMYAPGVSTPENNGFTINESMEIIKIIKNIDSLKSFDLVEYNPLFDINNKTKIIANNILKEFMNK